MKKEKVMRCLQCFNVISKKFKTEDGEDVFKCMFCGMNFVLNEKEINRKIDELKERVSYWEEMLECFRK